MLAPGTGRRSPGDGPRAVEIVNLDKLTYAGNPDNLRAVEADPRYTFVHGDICDRDAVRRAAEGADAIVNFAAETHVDRSIVDPEAFLRTDILGTHTLLEAVRELGIKRMVQVSHRRGLRVGGRGLLRRGLSPGPLQPLLGLQGRRRPAGARLSPHLRGAGHDHPGLQHVRLAPVSGEAHPPLRDQRSGGREAAALRRRPQCARLAARGRPLRRHPVRARARRAGPDLQRGRRQRAHQPGDHGHHPRRAGAGRPAAGGGHPPGAGPPRARPPLLAGLRQAGGRRVGARGRLRGRAPGDHPLVPGQRLVVAKIKHQTEDFAAWKRRWYEERA